MSDDLATRVAAIDAATLLPLVERALEAPVHSVTNWQFTPVTGGLAAGVWRFAGHAGLPTGEAAWSMILKVPGEEVFVGDPWGGVREPVVYQSGFRSPVPDNFTLPKCYGVVEQSIGRPWIWLEDVNHDPSPIWTDARYAEVARSLGRFNGAFLVGYPLPAWPWLAATSHLHQLAQVVLPALDFISAGEPFWRQQGPSACRVMDRYLDFYFQRQHFLALVDRLPLTLCHGDAFQRNLLVREVADVSSQLVAVDWSQAGMSLAGADAGHLVALAAIFSHIAPNQMQSLDRVVFPAYMRGLRDAGWNGDEPIIRLGYALATALWDGLILCGTATSMLAQEQERYLLLEGFGWPRAQATEYMLAILEYHLDLADEARELAAKLHIRESKASMKES